MNNLALENKNNMDSKFLNNPWVYIYILLIIIVFEFNYLFHWILFFNLFIIFFTFYFLFFISYYIILPLIKNSMFFRYKLFYSYINIFNNLFFFLYSKFFIFFDINIILLNIYKNKVRLNWYEKYCFLFLKYSEVLNTFINKYIYFRSLYRFVGFYCFSENFSKKINFSSNLFFLKYI